MDTNTSQKVQLLSHDQVQQKIKRIAHQIIELSSTKEHIHLVGIRSRGFLLAEKLIEEIRQHTQLEVHLHGMEMDKDNPLAADPALSSNIQTLNDQCVFLVDDVLNSGKTLIHAVKFLLSVDIERLTTVVLADRRHRRFPIKADLAGLTLSTTLQEHIQVEFGNQDAVYLM